jgi:hypothetical protein
MRRKFNVAILHCILSSKTYFFLTETNDVDDGSSFGSLKFYNRTSVPIPVILTDWDIDSVILLPFPPKFIIHHQYAA